MLNDPLSFYLLQFEESEPAEKSNSRVKRSFFVFTNIIENAVNIGFSQAFSEKMNRPSLINIENLGFGFFDYNELKDIIEYRRNHAE